MESLKYSIIKTEEQYDTYCNLLEDLLIQENVNLSDEMELLTLLIEKWDKEHNSFNELDPVYQQGTFSTVKIKGHKAILFGLTGKKCFVGKF